MIEFLICLLITVAIHEAGHVLTALKFGIGVKAYSIGFGKILIHKKINGIDFRLSLLPLGGYADIQGMTDKESPKDFFTHPYRHKFAVLIAGVAINILLALGVYLIHFGSISVGFAIDWIFIKSAFTRDYSMVEFIFRNIPINFFLLQLSILNMFCGLTNLIPIPGLDGAYLWMYLMEKKWGDKFPKYLAILTYSGYAFLIILQIYLMWWIYFK